MKKMPKNTFQKGNKMAEGLTNSGAPTKFKSKYVDMIIDYFSIPATSEYTFEKSTEYFASGEVKKESEKKRPLANKMPTLYGFSKKIGVAYSTVRRWAEKGQEDELKLDPNKMYTSEQIEEREKLQKSLSEFCSSYKEAKELQKEFLISLGLSGATPPASFIFVAKNVTDMRDKVETDLTSKGKEITGFTITRITREDVQPKEDDAT